jgi:hypothetical protein
VSGNQQPTGYDKSRLAGDRGRSAAPMTRERRLRAYRQQGPKLLTPAQDRRLNKKHRQGLGQGSNITTAWIDEVP